MAQCGLHLLEPGKSSLYPRGPSPRERHPRRESNEESPESRRLFGAGLGARSPQRTPGGKHENTNVFAQKRTYAAPPVPFFVLRRDCHKKTHKPKLNQLSAITAPTIRERTTGDLDPRRNRNEAYRSPSCLALASSSKREPNAISGIPQPPGAAMKPPTPRRTAPARTHASAGTISGRHKRRAGAQFTPI